MSKIFLGIDISKSNFDVALLLPDMLNHKMKTKKFPNDKQGFNLLITWLKIYGNENMHVCMEATGTYGEALADFLYQSNFIVSVVNPMQIRGFGMSELSRTKTDRADSKLIARFCKAIQPPAWQPIPENIKKLRDLLNRLEDYKNIKQQETNRLEVASIDIKYSIEGHIKFLGQEIIKIKKNIKEHVTKDPELNNKKNLLSTIPGVGETTIMQILGFLSNIKDFKNAKQLSAFVGLNPKQRQSGSSVRLKTHISKAGNSNLRKTFYFPAIVAKNHNPVVKAFCERLKATGKPSMVIICAAMRKLIHIIYEVLKSGKAFDISFAKI